MRLLHVLTVVGMWGVIVFIICAMFHGAKKRNG